MNENEHVQDPAATAGSGVSSEAESLMAEELALLEEVRSALKTAEQVDCDSDFQPAIHRALVACNALRHQLESILADIRDHYAAIGRAENAATEVEAWDPSVDDGLPKRGQNGSANPRPKAMPVRRASGQR